MVNQTTESLVVECSSGFDGGLDQTFHMEVRDARTGQLIANATGDRQPEFEVTGLNSGRGMKIVVYAMNSAGRSEPPAVLDGFTLKVAELQVENPPIVPVEFTPVLGVLIGVVLTLMLVALVIILVLRMKYKSGRAAANRKQQQEGAPGAASGAPVVPTGGARRRRRSGNGR